MGAEPWDYFVEYENDIQAVLDKLKEREFQAGRFRYSEENPSTIDEAREIADADGTASILDMDRIGTQPDFGVLVPLSKKQLTELFGTDKPTRAMIEQSMDFYEDIERGQGIYIVAYDGNNPSEIFFGGYSYD